MAAGRRHVFSGRLASGQLVPLGPTRLKRTPLGRPDEHSMTISIRFPFELETDRLTIRSPSEADAAQLLEAVSETIDELRPWMPWADRVPTIDEARENCLAAEAAFRDG